MTPPDRAENMLVEHGRVRGQPRVTFFGVGISSCEKHLAWQISCILPMSVLICSVLGRNMSRLLAMYMICSWQLHKQSASHLPLLYGFVLNLHTMVAGGMHQGMMTMLHCSLRNILWLIPHLQVVSSRQSHATPLQCARVFSSNRRAITSLVAHIMEWPVTNKRGPRLRFVKLEVKYRCGGQRGTPIRIQTKFHI